MTVFFIFHKSDVKIFLIRFLISTLRTLVSISFFEFIKAVNENFKTLDQNFIEGKPPWSQRDSAARDNYYGVVVEEFLTIKRKKKREYPHSDSANILQYEYDLLFKFLSVPTVFGYASFESTSIPPWKMDQNSGRCHDTCMENRWDMHVCDWSHVEVVVVEEVG